MKIFNIQAEDRAHRIGRVGTVNIEYLLAKGTSDDWLWKMLEKKLEVLTSAGLESSATDDTVVDLAKQKEIEKENMDDWDDDEAFEALIKHQEIPSRESTGSNKSLKELISPSQRKLKDAADTPGQLKMDHFYEKTPTKMSTLRLSQSMDSQDSWDSISPQPPSKPSSTFTSPFKTPGGSKKRPLEDAQTPPPPKVKKPTVYIDLDEFDDDI